ncbi:alanine racemase [Niallia sp. 01092]|uniref:alanine racemase n=1 Tax=unclassified Niallia TaxID=2837522 RepID=UPI003FCF9FFC
MLENERLHRDTWVEVDLDCIAYNVSELKKRLNHGSKLFAVVKANGYGHGALQIARTALLSGSDYLAVAFLDEAIHLRQKGITAPILVLGAIRYKDINIAVKYDITMTMFEVEWLKKAVEILEPANTLKIHIKIDTGMGRIGLRDKEEIKEVERLITPHKNIKIEGVFTHFATADELNSTYLEQQLKRFQFMLSYFSNPPAIVHCSNSAASLLYPDMQFNAVRMGISMYGLTPSIAIEKKLPYPLKEAFSLHTRIVQVKKLQKGDKVSYGATYEAAEEEWVATLPIGYADGWLRKLSGQEVLVNGRRAPIIGRVCMDQCMIKLPFYMEPGTKVTLIGKQNIAAISVNDIAAKLQTINYEVTCTISNRVPRVYKKDGKIVDVVNPLIQ